MAAAAHESDDSLRKFFAGILDVAEDGVVTVDDRHRIVLFNHGAEKLFRYERGEVLGRSLNVIIPERFARNHDAQLDDFARSPIVARNMGERREVYGRRKNGEEFPADVTISKMRVDDRLYLTAIVRDISERRRAQEAILKLNQELEQRVIERTAELTEMTEQLRRKNIENETFVYSVSHDLRSPLVNLQGFSQELKIVSADLRKILTHDAVPADVRAQAAKLLDGEMKESLSYIEAAVARLSRIIDALLRLSRAGRVEYHPRSVDLNELVGRIVNAAHGTIAERNAEVVVKDLHSAWGDPIALEQVFGNLIGNALNYLRPDEPGRIEVGERQFEDKRVYYVRDNGLGIPEKYLPQLFRAFRRLHPEVAGGEGMGLAIVRQAVERHGGKIWAESKEGYGATFYVSFPEPGDSERLKQVGGAS